MISPRGSRGVAAFVAGTMCAVAGMVLASAVGSPSPAYGQIPDSGAQRTEMLKEQRVANERLAEIAGLLREIRDQNKAGAGKGKPAQP